jgi:hypothetical protein
VGELGSHEEPGGAVRARGDARTAADARGRVERALGGGPGDQHRVRGGRVPRPHGHVAARLHDAVERAAIDHEIAHDGKGAGSKGLQGDGRSVAKRSQREQTCRRSRLRPVGPPVHHDATRAADALATVAVEGDRGLAERHQPVVEAVEGFEQRHVGAHVVEPIADEAAGRSRVALAPDAKRELHRYDRSRRGAVSNSSGSTRRWGPRPASPGTHADT